MELPARTCVSFPRQPSVSEVLLSGSVVVPAVPLSSTLVPLAPRLQLVTGRYRRTVGAVESWDWC